MGDLVKGLDRIDGTTLEGMSDGLWSLHTSEITEAHMMASVADPDLSLHSFAAQFANGERETTAMVYHRAARSAHKRRVAISGVTSGLGKALLECFSGSGAKVYGCGRRAAELEALRAAHPSAELRRLDVTDDAAVAAWADDCEGVDLVVANAGVSPESEGPRRVAWEVSASDFGETVDTNVKGVANLLRHFVPKLLARGDDGGTFVALSSGLGRSPNPNLAAYCASKWAVEGLLKAAAMALPAPFAAVPLAPGVVRTRMQRGENDGSVEAWVQVAAPMILALGRSENGKSMSVPGFYTPTYIATWTIPDGAPLPEALGHNF